ncbi:uncharacterized protein [Euphorbia lathyris]|uniref:uncharacterized protein isoform X2 n=1 Tax=Euphorbia lathyris TaxID=212925 RepID=UPI00331407CE
METSTPGDLEGEAALGILISISTVLKYQNSSISVFMAFNCIITIIEKQMELIIIFLQVLELKKYKLIGQAAVITPRQLTSGLGSRRVKAIAAAKHHTVLATQSGEVFTWGSNREGQLGYTVDTQPTPRRVSSLRSRIVAVAAANKHTAVVSDSGEVFTWGCNREGQLGYGTSNSASNYTPRLVEYLKGKVFKGVAAAKYHTIVLGAEGEVYTWGHRLVTPRRVLIARNLKKSGSSPLKFHRMERLHVASIAAGMVHSLALTDDGALFYWVSSDPDLKCQQLYSFCGKNVASISAGKYWSSLATTTGDVYMWDGKEGTDKPPVITRLHGVKRATSVSVGETHLLIVGSLYHPIYPPSMVRCPQKPKLRDGDEMEELDGDFMFSDTESSDMSNSVTKDDFPQRPVPSLKSLCEKLAAENLVEPRNAIQMLEIADSLGAEDLRKHCEDIVIHNLDYVLTVSSHAFASTALEILANLENLFDLRSSEPWSYRRLPTPTATFPLIINGEEENSECDTPRSRDNHKNTSMLRSGDQRSDFFLQPDDDPNQGISRKVRALRKKLQQIEMLEVKQSNGHLLDDQQLAKLETRSALEVSLAELGVPVETSPGKASTSSDMKVNKKAEASKKQKRKSKQKAALAELEPSFSGTHVDSNLVKDPLVVEISQVSINKVEKTMSEQSMGNQPSKEVTVFVEKKDSSDLLKSKSSSPAASKKKNRKGGLSMFLSGALDDTPKEVAKEIAPPPITPRSEGPAWGGAKISKGSASLRVIQDEQSKTLGKESTKNKEQVEDGKSDGKVLLSSFLTSKPIPVVVSSPTSQGLDAEKGTPPWVSGTPPQPSRPSLRDIQIMQQVKQHQNIPHSPKTRTAGFTVPSSQGSPSDSSGMNRWFKPDIDAPSSIRSIQIEEKAMKDLKRFYSSVKIVRNAT